jgi:hypothetical protein
MRRRKATPQDAQSRLDLLARHKSHHPSGLSDEMARAEPALDEGAAAAEALLLEKSRDSM